MCIVSRDKLWLAELETLKMCYRCRLQEDSFRMVTRKWHPRVTHWVGSVWRDRGAPCLNSVVSLSVSPTALLLPIDTCSYCSSWPFTPPTFVFFFFVRRLVFDGNMDLIGATRPVITCSLNWYFLFNSEDVIWTFCELVFMQIKEAIAAFLLHLILWLMTVLVNNNCLKMTLRCKAQCLMTGKSVWNTTH